MSPPVSPVRVRRRRRPVAVGLVLACVVLAFVTAGLLGFRLNVPTRSIARPPADAGPAAVVHAYVEAYDARDLSALRALGPGSGGHVSRFRAMGSFSDLAVEDTRTDDGSSLGGPAGDAPARGRVYVPVTMTAHGMDATELGFRDGPMLWGFFLERDDPRSPWLIVDQGVG